MIDRIKNSFVGFLILIGITALGQFNPERTALNRLNKGQWNSVTKILDKSLRKDSSNIEALYVYTLLHFTSNYPKYNIDTANHYRIKTSKAFLLTDSKSKDRLKRFPVDSIIIKYLKKKIDSAAFEYAKNLDTEASYIHFLNYYPGSDHEQAAIELRDEAAFVIALKQNTYLAFKTFLKKYPNSHRYTEASQRYERLLYDHETRLKRLEDYSQFIIDHPQSPYLNTAIQKVFDLSTLDGSEQSFETFIKSYPNHKAAKVARDILFHIKVTNQEPVQIPDSLKNIYPLQEWIPFSENDKWGFVNEKGITQFQPTLSSINEEYFCEPLKTDFILTPNQIIGRNGAIIYKQDIKTAADLGFGFMLVEIDSTSQIIHKSGRLINTPPLQDAFMLGSQYIACKYRNKWGIYSLTGFNVIPSSLDKVMLRGHTVILTKSNKEIIVDIAKLLSYSQNKFEPLVADEIKRYGAKYFWIRNGGLEKVTDEDLIDVIPFDRHRITYEAVGLVVRKNNYSYLKNWPVLSETPLQNYKIAEPWLITRRTGEKSDVHYIPTKQTITSSFDSVWFDQSFAAIIKADTLKLWQAPIKQFTIPFDENYSIRQTKDSVTYILTKTRNRTNVYLAENFNKVMTTSWPEIEPILKGVFIIKEKGKQGLIDSNNKILLKPEYDALLYSSGKFTLLKDKKFGTFEIQSKKLIKPTFETNLVNYSNDWILGRKGNKLAFINEETLKKPNYEFDEVTFWTDSIALVRINKLLALYSIFNKKLTLDNIETFQIIKDSEEESFAIFSINKLFGLISTKDKTIIQPQYEELNYLKANDAMLFIGMKPIDKKEAEIHYINKEGIILRKTRTDFDTAYSILCDN